MRDADENMIHKKAKELEGSYELKTNWGSITIKFDAIPNWAGGKGCPDEVLCLKIGFPAFGTHIELTAPILIEGEKAGSNSAKEDVEKFCNRSITGEQKSYLKIPVIVVGGRRLKKVPTSTKILQAQFNTTQVPRIIVD
jgi:hypothetical protein